MTRTYNNGASRWYLCECDRRSCREEFYMRESEYKRATLGEVRLVVPSHKPPNAKVLARWSGAVMIERKERSSER